MPALSILIDARPADSLHWDSGFPDTCLLWPFTDPPRRGSRSSSAYQIFQKGCRSLGAIWCGGENRNRRSTSGNYPTGCLLNIESVCVFPACRSLTVGRSRGNIMESPYLNRYGGAPEIHWRWSQPSRNRYGPAGKRASLPSFQSSGPPTKVSVTLRRTVGTRGSKNWRRVSVGGRLQ